MLDHFLVGHFRFDLRVLRTLYLRSLNKGNTLRGAFGRQLRRLSCLSEGGCDERCRFPEQCVYGRVFQPSPPPGAPLSKYQDIPRPYVIRAPLTRQTVYRAGSTLSFEFLLFCNANEFLQPLAFAFAEAAREGLGTQRTPLRLQRVWQLLLGSEPQLVYDSRAGHFEMPGRLTPGAALVTPPRERVTVRLLTPLSFKVKEEGRRKARELRERDLRFHHFLKRLRNRINSLSLYYGGLRLDLNFKELGELSEGIGCHDRELWWEDRDRRRGADGQWHPMGGIMGRFSIEGDLRPFWPLLCAGQWTHVGRYAVWGNGRYQLE